MAGYNSQRTGAATKALLDQVENQCAFAGVGETFVNGYFVLATGNGRQITTQNSRVSNTNAVIAAGPLANNSLVFGVVAGSENRSLSTNSGVSEGWGSIKISSSGSASVVLNSCNLGNNNLTLSGGTVSNIAGLASVKANKGTLLGVYLTFKFNSTTTYAIVSGEYGNYINANFTDGTGLIYDLVINANDGVYSLYKLFDASANHFLVQD